jgi:hypothetical protein
VITDPAHANRLLTDIATWSAQLARRWADEHAASYQPRSADGQPSSSGPADPTSTIATLDRKHHHADRIGTVLLSVHKRLQVAVAENTPRTPDGDCRCCRREPATRLMDEHTLKWTVCVACHNYRRMNRGARCPEQVHDKRPQSEKMCACPQDRCRPCPRQVEPGRPMCRGCRAHKGKLDAADLEQTG